MRPTESCATRSDLRGAVPQPQVVDARRAPGASSVPGQHSPGGATVAGGPSRSRRGGDLSLGGDRVLHTSNTGVLPNLKKIGLGMTLPRQERDDCPARVELLLSCAGIALVLLTAAGWPVVWVAQLCLWIAGGAS